MLRGRLKDDPGYVETWGTIKGVIEVWEETSPAGSESTPPPNPRLSPLTLKGEVTDIVELYSWLLPSIQNAHPNQDLYIGDIKTPNYEAERDMLRLEIRAFLEANSDRMEKVTPNRQVEPAP
jgi:hypothetical protein